MSPASRQDWLISVFIRDRLTEISMTLPRERLRPSKRKRACRQRASQMTPPRHSYNKFMAIEWLAACRFSEYQKSKVWVTIPIIQIPVRILTADCRLAEQTMVQTQESRGAARVRMLSRLQ